MLVKELTQRVKKEEAKSRSLSVSRFSDKGRDNVGNVRDT